MATRDTKTVAHLLFFNYDSLLIREWLLVRVSVSVVIELSWYG